MPTVTIPAASIQDTLLYGGSNNNYGAASPSFSLNSATPRSVLVRLDKSLIPAGTILAFRWFIFTGTAGLTMTVRRLTDANADWVEGTKTGTTSEVGSACYTYKAYNTVPWAGSQGARTSVTDYDAVGVDVTTAGNAYLTVDLPVGWASDWRDNIRQNGGFIVGVTSGTCSIITRENSSNKPYFEIDYSSPAASGAIHATHRRRRAA